MFIIVLFHAGKHVEGEHVCDSMLDRRIGLAEAVGHLKSILGASRRTFRQAQTIMRCASCVVCLPAEDCIIQINSVCNVIQVFNTAHPSLGVTGAV